MADCAYQRCVQQKRYIRRELQRWTKNMVYIVGLERIAEELMGRRKWKLYQESMSRNYLQPINNNVEKVRTSEDFGKELLNQREVFVDEGDRITKGHKIGNDADPQVTTANAAEGEVSRGHALTDHEEDELKDWTPETKCHFCVDGKLDSENHSAHGAVSPRHSDSDLSDSPSDSEAPPTLTPPANNNNNNNNNTNHHHRLPYGGSPAIPTLDSVTSMAALAAVAALAGPPGGPATPPLSYPTLLHPSWYLANNFTRGYPPEVAEKAAATAGEQPLDLSSKPATSSASTAPIPNDTRMAATLRLPLDNKHIFKAKPRMSAVAGRRTYTEDELQAALQDIQSGKLGTRRAAVLYGIPRSTLRNKVYKLAMERERELHLNPSTPLKLDDDEAMDDDKELSGAEEEKEVEKALRAPLLSTADLVRLCSLQNQEALKNVLHKSKEMPEIWASLEHSEMAPLIQNFLLASTNPQQQQHHHHQHPSQHFDADPLQLDLIRRIIGEDHFRREKHLQNNGESDRISRSSPSNSIASKPDRGKSESDMETDDSPSNVILKIPSFKPTTSKNGSDFCRSSSDSANIASPPLTSECGSPPILPSLPGRVMSLKDVKDVIAKSISQKFQQTPDPPPSSLRMPPMLEMEYKRGGGYATSMPMDPLRSQMLTRPYPHPSSQPPPPKPSSHQHQQSSSSSSSSNSAGGKGTRPKRGKYRNYDRDSLVEAVRAVQRGEMSVHRAGSYYGVPHSTLEYKVKERHLMRPRKRDPKPNPVDEKLASLKQNDMRNAAAAAAVVGMDKMKPGMQPPQPKFSPTSPNGIKLPMFDHNMAPLGYNAAPPYPFWPHPSFPHIPLEYRTPPTATFPPNPDQFFVASQMMQKLQEDSVRTHSNLNQPQPSGSTGGAPAASTLPKSTRQIAESLLDGSGSKGSFLDGIIRSSLESGVPVNEDKSCPKDEKNVAPENMSNKALLDQLCRNSRLTPLPKPNTLDCTNNMAAEESYRRVAACSSPLNYSGNTMLPQEEEHVETRRVLERERAASATDLHTIELSNDSNTSSSERNSKSEEEQQQQQQQRKPSPPGRIYLKQDLAKPENLKPEMLVRFRDVMLDVDRNGIGETATGSASESDVAQD